MLQKQPLLAGFPLKTYTSSSPFPTMQCPFLKCSIGSQTQPTGFPLLWSLARPGKYTSPFNLTCGCSLCKSQLLKLIKKAEETFILGISRKQERVVLWFDLTAFSTWLLCILRGVKWGVCTLPTNGIGSLESWRGEEPMGWSGLLQALSRNIWNLYLHGLRGSHPINLLGRTETGRQEHLGIFKSYQGNQVQEFMEQKRLCI